HRDGGVLILSPVVAAFVERDGDIVEIRESADVFLVVAVVDDRPDIEVFSPKLPKNTDGRAHAPKWRVARIERAEVGVDVPPVVLDRGEQRRRGLSSVAPLIERDA